MSAATQPVARFHEAFERAKAARIAQPEAMALATADAQGRPSVRMVLLKHADERGFVFYTNLESRKGDELAVNPHVALCFFWEAINEQVRVEGRAEPVSDAEADAYFASRAWGSQLGAWASAQSRPMSSRASLVANVAAVTLRFAGRSVPRPPHWSGFRVVPSRIEHWKGQESRLHLRELWERRGEGWESHLLFP